MKYFFFGIILCTLSLILLSACSSKKPAKLGVNQGQLQQCPDTPNCVSSQAKDAKHAIQPILAYGNSEIVMIDLASTIESMFGSKVITLEDNYLHAEFTSRIIRFVDDLECYYEEEKGLIQIRSASRVGYSDLNANRKRVEELRTLFEKKLN